MPKKNTTASEPIVSSGAQPVRVRKHAPAKRTSAAAVEPSSSIAPTAITTIEADITSSYSVVTFDEIAKLAYSYWEARGCQGGTPDEDWLRAERELSAGTTVTAGV
jgi:hypothetical protein